MESEFISAMEPHLAKEIVKMSIGANEVEFHDPEVVEPLVTPNDTASPASIAPTAHSTFSYAEQAPKQQVQAVPYTFKPLNLIQSGLNISENNLELIMSVPIQITVELGRTRKKIRDIAELTVGNIVELDRQAGDQVDVVANGRLIARGDVVVVDDNYSVKITEIVKTKDSSETK